MAVSVLTRLADRSRIALSEIADYTGNLGNPAIRLGVTGLSRAGKTVFIASLVHNILHGGRLPVFDAYAQGRIRRAFLEPQPDDDVPRFSYEDHIIALTGAARDWPEGTRRMSQLRLTLDYEPQGFLARNLGRGRLSIDIVDYPGEWLLDLPLMALSYEDWSRRMTEVRAGLDCAAGRDWRTHLATIDPLAPADETVAVTASRLFRAYLGAERGRHALLSSLPPGRFLLPGDLDGSPLLTFAPLSLPAEGGAPKGSNWAMMARRYDSYLRYVVRPFFRDHFARLDRQIVLIDVLTALNDGADAVADLSRALTEVLVCFRHGTARWGTGMLGRRIDRIAIAATKGDLVHHSNHEHLEAIASRLVEQAIERAAFSGARIDVMTLAAIRATREASIREAGEELPCIVGVPHAGETLGDERFDGNREAALFPGDLPDDPDAALDGALEGKVRFLRFRPPLLRDTGVSASELSFPHIRLDRAINFLFGDKLT